MKFNNKILYENYKNIIKTCILDGYAVPVLIRDYDVPKEYKYTTREKERYYNQQTTKEKTNHHNMLKQRRETELSILRNKNEEYEQVYDFYVDEVNNFINKYPFFTKITESVKR